MKYLLLLALIGFSACVHRSQKINVQSSKRIIIPPLNSDTSKYTMLSFSEKKNGYLFDNNVKPYILTHQEVNNIENIIIKKVALYNKSIINNKFAETINHPEVYYKQTIAVISKTGEKEVWVNCFCNITHMSYWKTDWAVVNDGGSCYFSLEINLTTNKVIRFGVNGLA